MYPESARIDNRVKPEEYVTEKDIFTYVLHYLTFITRYRSCSVKMWGPSAARED